VSRAAESCRHALARTPTYRSWRSMKVRCHGTGSSSHTAYVAAGVVVCQRWRDSFVAFLDDMGERPPGKTLDRYPNKAGNYEPGNVRWATPAEQQRNKKSNILVEYDGVTMTIRDAWRLSGSHLSESGVTRRLQRGLSLYEALFSPK
jgi:hypothetical protein